MLSTPLQTTTTYEYGVPLEATTLQGQEAASLLVGGHVLEVSLLPSVLVLTPSSKLLYRLID